MHCKLCKRKTDTTTSHHLIPKSLHGRKSIKKKFATEELNTTIELCFDCHFQIHKLITEKDLAKKFYSLELLSSYSKVKEYLQWVRNKQIGVVSNVAY